MTKLIKFTLICQFILLLLLAGVIYEINFSLNSVPFHWKNQWESKLEYKNLRGKSISEVIETLGQPTEELLIKNGRMYWSENKTSSWWLIISFENVNDQIFSGTLSTQIKKVKDHSIASYAIARKRLSKHHHQFDVEYKLW